MTTTLSASRVVEGDPAMVLLLVWDRQRRKNAWRD